MEIDFEKYPHPKRLRHHTAPNLYIPLSELKEDKQDHYPPLREKIDWKEFFTNGKKPNALDIGCGKASFLFDFAEENPDVNILGIEVREKLPDWINKVVKAYMLNNCAALWYSVVNGIPFIEDSSIDLAVYLFPDPWTKRKHIKRRAYNEGLLSELRRVLKPGGKLFLATDIEEVHAYHLKLIEKHEAYNCKVVETDDEWKLPQTNKEKFCRKENIPFYRIVCTRK